MSDIEEVILAQIEKIPKITLEALEFEDGRAVYFGLMIRSNLGDVENYCRLQKGAAEALYNQLHKYFGEADV